MSDGELIFSQKAAPLWVPPSGKPPLCSCSVSHSGLRLVILKNPPHIPTASKPSQDLSLLSPKGISNPLTFLLSPLTPPIHFALGLPCPHGCAPALCSPQSIMWGKLGPGHTSDYKVQGLSIVGYIIHKIPYIRHDTVPGHLLHLILYCSPAHPRSLNPEAWRKGVKSFLPHASTHTVPLNVLLTCLISIQPSGLGQMSLF